MSCPAALSAYAPSDSWPTALAPPSCRSVNNYCWIILGLPLSLATLLVPLHASVVRNVPPPCCGWNLFLSGTLTDSCTRGLDLTPPNRRPTPLPVTESSVPIAFVSLHPLIALDYPLTSACKPRPDTRCYRLQSKLSSLTTLLLHSQRRRIFESPKQNP